jgi:hypothetical protein
MYVRSTVLYIHTYIRTCDESFLAFYSQSGTKRSKTTQRRHVELSRKTKTGLCESMTCTSADKHRGTHDENWPMHHFGFRCNLGLKLQGGKELLSRLLYNSWYGVYIALDLPFETTWNDTWLNMEFVRERSTREYRRSVFEADSERWISCTNVCSLRDF